MRNLLLLLTLTLSPILLNAQSYNTAVGIRLGTEIGITIKQRVLDHTTFEGIIQNSLKKDATTFTILLEQHKKLISKRFNFYLGGGLHTSILNNVADQDLAPSGITLIAGAEFTLGRLNLSWDYKPAINMWGGTSSFDSQTAISLRYVFIKRKKKKLNLRFWEKDKKGKKKRK